MSSNVTIDGITYAPIVTGNRAVIVVDRGWIFAGDVVEANGRIKLLRAVWLFSWSEIGLDGVIADPNSKKANLRQLSEPVDLPADAEIFRIPVKDGWGLK